MTVRICEFGRTAREIPGAWREGETIQFLDSSGSLEVIRYEGLSLRVFQF